MPSPESPNEIPMPSHIVVMKLGVSELDCIAVKNSVQYEGGQVIDEYNEPNLNTFTAKMSDGLAQKLPKNKWVEAIGPMDPVTLDRKRPTHIVSIKPDAPAGARIEVEALVTASGDGNEVIDDFPFLNTFSAILTPVMVATLLKHEYVKNVSRNGRSIPQAIEDYS